MSAKDATLLFTLANAVSGASGLSASQCRSKFRIEDGVCVSNLAPEDGRMGAVTGMLPNGVPDTSCMQSREIWTRVTYGLAASIFHEDMIIAFRTAGGIHELLCSKAGHGYSEPGGLDLDRQYRCMENAVGIDTGKSSKAREGKR